VRLDDDVAFAPADVDAADAGPAAAQHRQAQRVQCIGGDRAIWMDVVGGGGDRAIDLVARHELRQLDDIGRLAGDCGEFGVADRDVSAAFDLTAMRQRVGGHHHARPGVKKLLRYRIAGPGVELIETNAVAFLDRRRQADRTGHQGYPQKTVPHRISHRRSPLPRQRPLSTYTFIGRYRIA